MYLISLANALYIINRCRRLIAVPGVGPVVALAYRATVDVPARFRRSKAVGAVFGADLLQVSIGRDRLERQSIALRRRDDAGHALLSSSEYAAFEEMVLARLGDAPPLAFRPRCVGGLLATSQARSDLRGMVRSGKPGQLQNAAWSNFSPIPNRFIIMTGKGGREP